MSIREGAEEHLRVIRSLMERATHYRAISAQAALVGGLLSVIVGGGMFFWSSHHQPCLKCTLIPWALVLALTALVNFYFLWRDSRRRGEAVFSPRGIWALRALAPALLLCGAGTWLVAQVDLFLLGLLWSGAYGAALLAAAHFAPPSLGWLGRAFAATALLFVLGVTFAPGLVALRPGAAFEAYMAFTFGLYHLLYAAFTWPRSAEPDASGHV